MRVLSKSALRACWDQHPEWQTVLSTWYMEVKAHEWSKPSDVTQAYPKASAINDNRVVFRITNEIRLVAWINYRHACVYIKWVGHHRDYNRIDAATIGR